MFVVRMEGNFQGVDTDAAGERGEDAWDAIWGCSALDNEYALKVRDWAWQGRYR